MSKYVHINLIPYDEMEELYQTISGCSGYGGFYLDVKDARRFLELTEIVSISVQKELDLIDNEKVAS